MKSYLRKTLYTILTALMDREKLMFLLSNKEERALLGFKRQNYLYDIGWTNSVINNKVIDLHNNPIPWVTYPFIQFMEERLKKSMEVFEFGSGNSTLYYANKVALVDSVEHGKAWYEKIKNEMPRNVNLYFSELVTGGDYSNYASKTGKLYDIVIVDGEDRVNCILNNIHSLKIGGIIILDDSEREEYEPAKAFLKEKDFRKIDFWGIAPTVSYLKCTTIFYRTNNCLGI